MIEADYCVQMARYNAWQNGQIRAAVRDLPEDALTRDRGAHFGSLFATLNHLLWGDAVWMARFTDAPAPEGGIAGSTGFTATPSDWDRARQAQDAAILDWAAGLTRDDLTGTLSWYSGATGREMHRPRALCVVHMFNHQTHHRGQVHAMLTQAGAAAPVTDLAFFPEDWRFS